MNDVKIAEAAGGVGMFLGLVVMGVLYGGLALMLISFGAWPWLMWAFFGVYMLKALVGGLNARKKLIDEARGIDA